MIMLMYKLWKDVFPQCFFDEFTPLLDSADMCFVGRFQKPAHCAQKSRCLNGGEFAPTSGKIQIHLILMLFYHLAKEARCHEPTQGPGGLVHDGVLH